MPYHVFDSFYGLSNVVLLLFFLSRELQARNCVRTTLSKKHCVKGCIATPPCPTQYTPKPHFNVQIPTVEQTAPYSTRGPTAVRYNLLK
uniref:Putative secreted protein n=1 Tax=Ixodes ricinus TaxID=34613 RepID=A0A6B0UCF5_IXORI